IFAKKFYLLKIVCGKVCWEADFSVFGCEYFVLSIGGIVFESPRKSTNTAESIYWPVAAESEKSPGCCIRGLSFEGQVYYLPM
uniref:hypothetical protein n=1 Tax=Alistipes putredinis TaxID=28117 RepID=UPI003FD81A9C